MNIRNVTFEDCEQMVELTRELGYPSNSEKMCEILDHVINHPDHAIFVCEIEGHIAGYVHLVDSMQDSESRITDIAALLVSTNNRGQGIGDAFIRKADKICTEKGSQVLRIRRNLINSGAYHFFENRGFVSLKIKDMFVKQF